MNEKDKAYIPTAEIGFKLADKVVKTILISYLKMFKYENIISLAPVLGCSIYKIPDTYINHSKLIHTFQALPASFAKENSLYNIPNTSEPVEFKRIPLDTVNQLQRMRAEIIKGVRDDMQEAAAMKFENESIEFQKWNIYLKTIDTKTENIPDYNECFKQFDNDKEHIKKMVEGAYHGACGVFFSYRRKNEDLESINLILNKDNFCLCLVDTKFPKFEYPIKIYFDLERIQ